MRKKKLPFPAVCFRYWVIIIPVAIKWRVCVRVYEITNQRYIMGQCPLKDFMTEAVTPSE